MADRTGSQQEREEVELSFVEDFFDHESTEELMGSGAGWHRLSFASRVEIEDLSKGIGNPIYYKPLPVLVLYALHSL
jgi:hypothetical protein